MDVAKERREVAVVAGASMLAAALTALFFYKWGGSLRAVEHAARTGTFGASPDALATGGVWMATAHYFARIWPALAYGLVIGAIVRAAISPRWVARLLGRGRTRATVAGALCGSPLMLCSCCVTPVFTSVYERGARLGGALSLMLASPGLNLAAFALTLLLLPPRFALLRLAAAVLLVFVVAPAIGKRHEGVLRPRAPAIAADEPPVTLGTVGVRFARSLAYLVVLTVPMIVGGVVVSAWLLPHAVHLPALGAEVTVILVALLGTLVALPTFFEVPMAMVLLQLGAPSGAAAALLVAGPIVNLPSLLVLGRETSVRVAFTLASSVWIAACLAGLAASFG